MMSSISLDQLSHDGELSSDPEAVSARYRERFGAVASADGLALLERLLCFNHEARITADEALKHPHLSQFHDPSQELAASFRVHVPIDDNAKKGTAVYRESLYNEIRRIRAVEREERLQRQERTPTRP